MNKKINENLIGQKLWKKAKKLIPGGNMLLSKRPEMFLPNKWPTYFSKAKGCKVWDLDGNEFIDISSMGVGTNILGYGNDEVDNAVREVITKGNLSTLNCPEEVYLAEKLIEMHKWAEMVKFARTGGEANAIAIRIARAASGKDKVAFCGYHGWHDWYISANINNSKNLNNHLIKDLKPIGVPSSLKETSIPFSYNSFKELKNITENNDIGIIKMEVFRNEEPKDDFLKKVRDLATEKNIILIFDECTSGFRKTFGGLHKHYNIEPDMALFGKTLGNGYGISAVIGKQNIMETAQDTFISSTFWTERIGPTAALKTLEIMKHKESWINVTSKGKKIEKFWNEIKNKYNLNIHIQGQSAMTNFFINSPNWLKYKTYITQEMLKKGFLATNSVNVCTEHDENILNRYYEEIDPIFKTISDCENGKSIDNLLEVPICHAKQEKI